MHRSTSALAAAFPMAAVPQARAQAAFKPGDTIWGHPNYEQWSKCVIRTAQPDMLVTGHVQYTAVCQIIENGKYVPENEVLVASQTKPYGGASPREAGGVAHMTAGAAPRAPLDCARIDRGRAGAPDPKLVHALIQCGLEAQVATGVVPLASSLSIVPMGSRPWRMGYAYHGMQGGQGGDRGAGGPGTIVYRYKVRATVTSYTSGGNYQTPRNETWNCFYTNNRRWVCGIGD